MKKTLKERAFILTYRQIGERCLCMQKNTYYHAKDCKFFFEIYDSNLKMIKKLLAKKIYREGYTTKEECGVKENEERA